MAKNENLNGNETIKTFTNVSTYARLSSSEMNLMQVLQTYEKYANDIPVSVQVHNGETQVIEFDFNGLENLETDYLKFMFKKVSKVNETRYQNGETSNKQITEKYFVEIILK